MSDNNLFLPDGAVEHEIKIKRSGFIGHLSPAPEREAAENFIERCRKDHHSATHNCFAYRIDAQTTRFSDDGEPSGTAGRPILQMLEKYQLIQSALVVTRYFGGVKLGTGGLIRAYGQCAEETIRKAALLPFIREQRIELRYPYALTRQVAYWVDKHQGRFADGDFAAEVKAVVLLPAANAASFLAQLMAIGNGQISHLNKES
ncbi:MAG TPA: YigZ family protein [Calditrichia bacterium]|nr:YigZ family protein [Calditrichota bacterium]HQU71332.1 YigZ family protein [Calditrichia bacterium]HQV34580.1 YigZ family protein [Calditrichia bacterium]